MNATARPEYCCWRMMLSRCRNPNDRAYSYYGGRGITVCARWQKSFWNFLADVGPRPTMKHTLDRRDGNAGYKSGNVHWVATMVEQNRNKRNNRTMTFAGRIRLVVEVAAETGLERATIIRRLDRGWDDLSALQPVRFSRKTATSSVIL